jgi:hypothetical protein
MSPKEIKKLADACRRAGIKSFKNAEVEFTLSDVLPTTHTRSKRGNKSTIAQDLEQPDAIINNEDDLSEEELLFWSSPKLISEENQ